MAAALFGYIQNQSTFADPDSFYHTRLVQLTMADGPVTAFPWLPLTVLADGYADHHFLYHLLLIPFFVVFGPLVGIKVATVVFAAGTITAFYALLRTFEFNRYPLIPTTLLALSGGFLLRINLAKTPALAVTWLLLELMAIRQRRPGWLFLLAFSHVWLHGSWPLLAVMLGLYIGADWLVAAQIASNARPWRSTARASWRRWRGCLTAGLGGLAAGLVVNPFFPTNLKFYGEQIWQIAVVNYGERLTVGNEWFPLTFDQLIGQAPALTVMLLVVAGGFALLPSDTKKPHLDRNQVTALIFSVGWLALTAWLAMRQQRQLEYFTPALALTATLLLGLLLSLSEGRQLMLRLREVGGRWIANRYLLVGTALLFWLVVSVITINRVHYVNSGWEWDRYAAVAAWLEQTAPPDSLVFNLRWDDFPVLFYHSERLRWFSGLDPTFSYRADSKRWQRVEALWHGESDEQPSRLLTEIGSDYLFLRRCDGLKPQYSRDPNLELAYHDKEAIIFKLKP